MTSTTRNILLAALLSLLAVVSCRKDDDGGGTPAKQETVLSYMPGAPGSYWIYESYRVDSNGKGNPGSEFSGIPYIDSVYQGTDTTINGHSWKRLMRPDDPGGNRYRPYYYRDSANYLLDFTGEIIFSSTDTNRAFRTFAHDGVRNFSDDSAVIITVSTGDARTVLAEGRSIRTLAGIIDYSFRPYASTRKPVSRRRQYTRYAKGVGIVSETQPFYITDSNYTELRLIRSRVIVPVE